MFQLYHVDVDKVGNIADIIYLFLVAMQQLL